MATRTQSHGIGYRSGLRQKTLKQPIPCRGVGLHSGAVVSMVLRPAAADRGIRFLRTDVTDRDPWITARYDQVVDTQLCTVIGNSDGVRVGTIEHLIAALAGCEIYNAIIEIDAPEVPVMDGSSEPFVFLIDCVGTVELDAPRRAINQRLSCMGWQVRSCPAGRDVSLALRRLWPGLQLAGDREHEG